MGYVDYHEYIRSEEWAEKRNLVYLRANGYCEADGCVRRASQVHHKTYDNLGDEPLEDLEALCHRCHLNRHPDAAKKDRKERVRCPLCRWSHHPNDKTNSVPAHLKKTHNFPEDASNDFLLSMAETRADIPTSPTKDYLESHGLTWPPHSGWMNDLAIKLMDDT